jgi:cell division protein FtsW (lipid II flippase)
MIDLNAVKDGAAPEEQEVVHNPINSARMLLIIAVGIQLFGLTMLYSTTSSDPSGAALFHKQLVWSFVGLCAGMEPRPDDFFRISAGVRRFFLSRN